MTFTATTLRKLRELDLPVATLDRILEIFEEAKEAKPKKAAEKAARATRLPEDWKLPADWRELAIGLGLRDFEVTREADKMRNWSRSSKNGAKLDWKATWRNWCVSVLERAGRPVLTPNAPAPAAGDPAQFDQATWSAIAKRVKGGTPWNPSWGPPPGRMDCLMPAGML